MSRSATRGQAQSTPHRNADDSSLTASPARTCRRRRAWSAGRRSSARPRRRRDRIPRPLGVRRSRLPARLPAFPLCRSERAEGRQVFADRAGPAIQPEFPHLQFAQQLTSSRATRRRAWSSPSPRSWCAPATSRTPCTASPRRKCGAPPTASPIDSSSGRRRNSTTARALTAHDVAFSLNILKAQGPSAHQPIAARFCRRQGRRRRERHRDALRRKRARDVPLFVAGLPIFSRAYYATRAVR